MTCRTVKLCVAYARSAPGGNGTHGIAAISVSNRRVGPTRWHSDSRTSRSESRGATWKLHIHPYDEVFVVMQGRARLLVGDQVIDAEAGKTGLGPAGLLHRFLNLGPRRLQTPDIHMSPRCIQTDLK